MKERRPQTVCGGLTAANVAILWGLALNVPLVHIHPKITADLGQTMVLDADKQRLFSFRPVSVRLQLYMTSFMVSPPM